MSLSEHKNQYSHLAITEKVPHKPIEVITSTISFRGQLPLDCRNIRKRGEEAKNPAKIHRRSQDDEHFVLPYTRSRSSKYDKFSTGASRCVLVTIFGENRDGFISEVYHIQPVFFLNEPNANTYRIYYQDKLSYYAVMCKNGSVTAVIAGGSAFAGENDNLYDQSKFLNAAEWLDGVHKKHLGIDSLVLSPRNLSGLTDVYVATQERKLHLVHKIKKST